MRYLILDGEDVGQVSVVAFSPQMATRLAGDELRADPQAASSFANTSFQDVADVHGSGDLLGVDDLAFESERAVASHDLQRRNLRKVGDDVLGDSIAEVFLLAIVAEIYEWQDADRDRRRVGDVLSELLQGLVCCHFRDGRQQVLDRLASSIFMPRCQVDALQLPKSQRRLR